MAFTTRESIYQWMSKSVDRHQSQATQDENHSTAVRPDTRSNILPAELEILNTAQATRLNKRARDSSTRSQKGVPVNPSKRARNEYERRPRHKTRADRYDYKPSISNGKTQSRQGKTKRVRRGRKQSMSDGFHASNVARERLTLRQNANLGIFSKGRASSPVKIRGGPKPAFSENVWLSHKYRNHDEPPSAKYTAERERKGRGHTFQYDDLEAASRRVISASRKPSESAVANMNWRNAHVALDKESKRVISASLTPSESAVARPDQGRAYDRQQPSSAIKSKGGEKRDCSAPQSQAASSGLNGQIRAPDKISRSATPYSWSESQPKSMHSESGRELQLLDVLYAGLFPENDGDSQGQSVSRKSYCSLRELKSMLEARKAQWGSDVEGNDPAPGGSSDAGEGGTRRRRTNIDTRNATRQSPDLVTKDSPDGDLIVSDPGLPTESSQRFQALHEQTASHPSSSANRPVQGDSVAMTTDLQDDETFYRHLDEEFRQIINAESSIHSSRRRIHQRTPMRRRASKLKTGNSISAPSRHLSPFQLLDSLSYHIPGLDILALMPGHRTQQSPIQERASDPSGFQDLHAERRILTRGGQRAQAPYSTWSSRPPDPEVDQYPKGFWRQNSLY